MNILTSKMRVPKGKRSPPLVGASSDPMDQRLGFTDKSGLATCILNFELISKCPEISLVFDLRIIQERTGQTLTTWKPAEMCGFLKYLVYSVNYQVDSQNKDIFNSPHILAAICNIEFAKKKDGNREGFGHLHVILYGSPLMADLLKTDSVFSAMPGYVACFFQVVLVNFFSLYSEPLTFDTKVLRLVKDDFKGAVSIANFRSVADRVVTNWVRHEHSQFDYIIKDGIDFLCMFVSERAVEAVYFSKTRYNSSSAYYSTQSVPVYFPSHMANYDFLQTYVYSHFQGDARTTALLALRDLYDFDEKANTLQQVEVKIQNKLPHFTPDASFLLPNIGSEVGETLLQKRSEIKVKTDIKLTKPQTVMQVIQFFEQEALQGRAYSANEITFMGYKRFGIFLDKKNLDQIFSLYSIYNVTVTQVSPAVLLQDFLKNRQEELSKFIENIKMLALVKAYLNALIIFLGSPLGKGLLLWISSTFLKSSAERAAQLNKVLYLYGSSNSGKSGLFDVVFPKFLFSPAIMQPGAKFATDNVYDSSCYLWAYPDLNRNVSIDFLFSVQNLANGEEGLELKHKNRKTSTDVFRPIIICTTWDLQQRFKHLANYGFNEMVSPLTQFEKRLFRLVLPEPVLVYNDAMNEFFHSNVVTDCFRASFGIDKLPVWIGSYFFWLFALGISYPVEKLEETESFTGKFILEKMKLHKPSACYVDFLTQHFGFDVFDNSNSFEDLLRDPFSSIASRKQSEDSIIFSFNKIE